ncbi:triosephosphate isomerase [Candidatus Gottesmanbacteria bacterium]|nr:triosephosphate isomerase [Candidatus Gottesmanbacteria bacterium]
MKKKYIIGNWKSNKDLEETKYWFDTLKTRSLQNNIINWDNIEVVVCPPIIFLPLVKKLRDDCDLPLKIGAQNISPFKNGPYTGEVSDSMIAEFASYVIIGHSERRTNFSEDDSMLSEKVKRANEVKLNSIYCIQDENTFIPEDVEIVAYEPVWAIGTGKTDTPDNADRVAQAVKKRWGGKSLIYGGSVDPDNIKSFIQTNNIDGVLPGGSSLDPNKFWEMIVNAAKI